MFGARKKNMIATRSTGREMTVVDHEVDEKVKRQLWKFVITTDRQSRAAKTVTEDLGCAEDDRKERNEVARDRLKAYKMCRLENWNDFKGGRSARRQGAKDREALEDRRPRDAQV